MSVIYTVLERLRIAFGGQPDGELLPPEPSGLPPLPRSSLEARMIQARNREKREEHWRGYYMGFAEHASTKSKDTTKVGAILVGPDGEVRLTGFNGPPKGVRESEERRERPAKYLYTSHAEENLIAFAARQGIRTDGCLVYTTIHPCSRCARMMIQAGVKAVVYGPGKTSMPDSEFEAAAVMFKEADVHVRAVEVG